MIISVLIAIIVAALILVILMSVKGSPKNRKKNLNLKAQKACNGTCKDYSNKDWGYKLYYKVVELFHLE